MNRELTKDHFQTLGKTIEAVLNKGEGSVSEYGYVLIAFPFGENILHSMDFLSNIKEEDIEIVLNTAAELMSDDENAPIKQKIKKQGGH